VGTVEGYVLVRSEKKATCFAGREVATERKTLDTNQQHKEENKGKWKEEENR